MSGWSRWEDSSGSIVLKPPDLMKHNPSLQPSQLVSPLYHGLPTSEGFNHSPKHVPPTTTPASLSLAWIITGLLGSTAGVRLCWRGSHGSYPMKPDLASGLGSPMLAHLLPEVHCTGLPRQWLVLSIRIKQKCETLGPASLSGIARPWVLCSVGLKCSQYYTSLADALFMNLIDFFFMCFFCLECFSIPLHTFIWKTSHSSGFSFCSTSSKKPSLNTTPSKIRCFSFEKSNALCIYVIPCIFFPRMWASQGHRCPVFFSVAQCLAYNVSCKYLSCPCRTWTKNYHCRWASVLLPVPIGGKASGEYPSIWTLKEMWASKDPSPFHLSIFQTQRLCLTYN